MAGDPINPRLDGETDKAYAAFLAYRGLGMGRRNLEAVRQAIGQTSGIRTVRHLEGWSSQWNWLDRCRAFDDYILAVRHRASVAAAAQEAAKWECRRQL